MDYDDPELMWQEDALCGDFLSDEESDDDYEDDDDDDDDDYKKIDSREWMGEVKDILKNMEEEEADKHERKRLQQIVQQYQTEEKKLEHELEDYDVVSDYEDVVMESGDENVTRVIDVNQDKHEKPKPWTYRQRKQRQGMNEKKHKKQKQQRRERGWKRARQIPEDVDGDELKQKQKPRVKRGRGRGRPKRNEGESDLAGGGESESETDKEYDMVSAKRAEKIKVGKLYLVKPAWSQVKKEMRKEAWKRRWVIWVAQVMSEPEVTDKKVVVKIKWVKPSAGDFTKYKPPVTGREHDEDVVNVVSEVETNIGDELRVASKRVVMRYWKMWVVEWKKTQKISLQKEKKLNKLTQALWEKSQLRKSRLNMREQKKQEEYEQSLSP